MKAAYQSGKFASRCPLRFSYSWWAASVRKSVLAKPPWMRMPYQIRPGSRVVTSWTSHVLPSGSLKEQNEP